MIIVGRLLVLVAALFMSVQVIRNAAVAAFTDNSPASASQVWPSHPSAEIALGMTEIGTAARERRPVAASTFALIDKAAVKAPLAPEPFLVRGVRAELEGNLDLAAQAFTAAERRDPRSLPARYFLAGIFYRLGDPRRTLEQIAALARLAPNGTTTVAPYLASYARNRSAWPYLRDLFRSNPNLAEAALTALARDPGSADAVLALADKRGAAKSDWAPTLIGSLVRARQYAKARAVWAMTSNRRLPPGTTLYDGSFADAEAPPPFNWDLLSSTAGLAEREAGGRLHVIFYGQDDGLLARQLLVLPAGLYRMTMSVPGGQTRLGALRWSVRCDGWATAFAFISLDKAARGWMFVVPPACPAQWLELSGTSAEIKRQSEARVNDLKLVRRGGNG